MKKTAFFIFVFIFSFCVFLLIKLPAAVAINLASGYLPSELQIGQSSGTLWQGRIMQLRYQDEQINDLNWDISGWALFTGQLKGNLKFGNVRDTAYMSGRGNFSYGLLDQSVSLTHLTLRSRVERAMQRLQLPLPINAKGQVIVDIDKYNSGEPYCDALKGEISSPNIDVQGMSGWFSIGPLSGNLSCKSGDIAVIVDPDNRLGLEADAVLKANLDFKVAGFVKPDVTLPKEVHDAAKFLGQADRDGRYPLNF